MNTLTGSQSYRGRYPERARESTRRSVLKHRWKMPYEEYAAIIERGCAICEATENVHLDHSHTTGQIRGPLCRSCNNGLGRFRDDPERLRRAAAYLESFTNSDVE